ncbi:unnamed protein product [Mucor hiemalis]
MEDKLRTFGMQCKYEHLCHSWIVDPEDSSRIQHKVFSIKQLKEIKETKPVDIPKISDELVNYLLKFKDVKSTSDLRRLLMKHADMDWICRTPDNLLPLYEIEGTFKPVNNERWYQNRIWTMVDKLLETVQDVNVVRGEGSFNANEVSSDWSHVRDSLDNAKKVQGQVPESSPSSRMKKFTDTALRRLRPFQWEGHVHDRHQKNKDRLSSSLEKLLLRSLLPKKWDTDKTR